MANASDAKGLVGKEVMRRLELFEGLGEDDLDRLYGMARSMTIPEGELLIEEGEPGEELYIIIEGELEITKEQGGSQQIIATRKTGEVVGEMAVLQRAPRSASARAVTPTRVLVIDQNAFSTLLSCSASAALTVLHTVVTRLRSTESLLMQQEKLAALGTMAAGVAHELNNPAAALRRSTDQLQHMLKDWEQVTAELGALSLDAGAKQAVADLRNRAQEQPFAGVRLDALARSEREDEIGEWLEGHGVKDSWELAATLVNAGYGRGDLEPLAQTLKSDDLPVVARWLATTVSLFGLVEETHTSADAVSTIVSAVKSYAYLDRAPVQEVDVHKSLENTLVILRHKLSGGVEIRREYADGLPTIEAYGSELNQVWTNLIDNAIEAMKGDGVLRLRTYERDRQVVVEIADNGPGIPEEHQTRIFEPFFTTKSVGEGTGLGLHISYNIVVNRHKGQIYVKSEEGFTCFQVRLPLTLGA